MMRILLLGKIGQLGWELQRSLSTLGEVIALDYPAIDLANPNHLSDQILGHSSHVPHVIVNATAYTAVDRAESEAETAMAINGESPGIMAEIARSVGAALVHFSTDYVFDGNKGSPYLETDLPNPLGVYGKSKLAGEQAIQQVGGTYLILRTSWVYSMRRDSFVTKVLSWARQNPTLSIVDDQIGNPTWARALAEITAQLLAIAGNHNHFRGSGPQVSGRGIATDNRFSDTLNSTVRDPHDDAMIGWLKERSGIYHLAGSGYTSRLGWARAILNNDSHSEEQLTHKLLPAQTADFPTPAQRPLFSALNCECFSDTFGLRLPDWEVALQMAMEAV